MEYADCVSVTATQLLYSKIIIFDSNRSSAQYMNVAFAKV